MKSFLIPQKYQWVLANCQESLMICLGGEGGGVTLQVSLLSSYWEFVLPFALEGSVYAVNLFKKY